MPLGGNLEFFFPGFIIAVVSFVRPGANLTDVFVLDECSEAVVVADWVRDLVFFLAHARDTCRCPRHTGGQGVHIFGSSCW